MAATDDVELPYRTRKDFFARPQDSNTRLFGGALAAVLNSAHGTAAEVGAAKVWSGTAGEIPVGMPHRPQGITLAAAIGPGDAGFKAAENFEGDLEEGVIYSQLSVAGVTGVSDFLARVYWSDDNTPTLTDPGHGVPAGVVIGYVETGVAEVLMFTIMEQILLGLVGGPGPRTIVLGEILAAAFVAGAVPLRTWVATFNGRIKRVGVVGSAAGASSDGTVQARIGGVGVTTGTVTVDSTNFTGVNTTVFASPTALNKFKKGDVIDLLLVESVAVSIDLNVFIEVEADPGV